MKCPFCNSEMTSGYVRSARKVFFSESDGGNSLLCKPSKDDVVLSADNWVEPSCVAYRCKNCKKVIMDEPEEQKKSFRK